MAFFGKKIALIVSFYCLLHLQANCQVVSREELITAYVYAFAKNIEWPNKEESFNIQLITSNQALINEFNFLAENKKLGGKPIKVTASSSAIVSQQSHLVFVSHNFNSLIRSIFLQIQNQDILLITDRFFEDRYKMINFIEGENNTLSFEINRANIINQGLNIRPEMILMGGSDIDMAQLYKEAQDSIKALESFIEKLQQQYDSLLANVRTTKQQIEDQQALIINQSKQIKEGQSIIEWQNKTLDSLRQGVAQSEERLRSLIEQQKMREQHYHTLQESIYEQQKQLEEGKLMLQEQFRLIDEQDQTISEREKNLAKMESVVSYQKRFLILLVLFLLVIIGFMVVIFRAYKERRDHALALAQQRDELQRILSELRQTQSQLVQSEKMASLGVLTAGIAHEVNNAINYVVSGLHVLEQNIKKVRPVINTVRKLKKEDNKLPEKVD